MDELKQKLSQFLKRDKNIVNKLGCFELKEQLGQGGTSIVRSSSLNGNTNYAIKFFN